MKILLISLATNRYLEFIGPLWGSADTYFFPAHEVDYLLLTNRAEIEFSTPRRYYIHYLWHEPWPMITLKRFVFFHAERYLLRQYDYVFYIDADMLFHDEVTIPLRSEMILTLHPGFYRADHTEFTYDKNPRSRAYIAPGEGRCYFAGGFYGGAMESFCRMSRVISEWTWQDLDNQIIPRWHDESYLNRYAVNNPPDGILSPAYCYPESWILPFEPKIIALDKDHGQFRGHS